jgi:uncharacterized protein YdcH (DUF465 family)
MGAMDGYYGPEDKTISMSEAVDELIERDTAQQLRQWEARYNRLMIHHNTIKASISYISSQEYKAALQETSALRWENQKLKRLLLTQMY